jgi:hypothetical protein
LRETTGYEQKGASSAHAELAEQREDLTMRTRRLRNFTVNAKAKSASPTNSGDDLTVSDADDEHDR